MKTPFALVLACLTSMVFTGCMVGPKYVRPTAPTAPEFKEQPPDSFKESGEWKNAQPADRTLRGNWWEIFNDPQLNALEEQLTLSNQDLKVAETRLGQARSMIRFNRAALAPTIATSPSVAAVRNSANQPYFISSNANNGTGSFILPFDLSYEVDLWGRVRRTINASREETQATAADLQTASLSLHSELAIDYFELRSSDAQKQLLDDTVKAFTDALQLTQNRFKGGAAPRSDAERVLEQCAAREHRIRELPSNRDRARNEAA